MPPNLLQKTVKPQTIKPQPELSSSWGVSLKKSEWAEIEDMAAELNMSKGSLAALFVRYGLNEYKAGKIKTETRNIKTIKL